MIIKHRANTIDGNRQIQGFLVKMMGQYHIVEEGDEFKAHPVLEETIAPIFNKEETDEFGLFCINDIILSDNLTSEEASQFAWLLRKARGKMKK